MPKKLMTKLRLHAGRGLEFLLIVLALVGVASAQAVNTTTVQGTVYLANGQPASGTVLVSWPAFTTASNQAVTADSVTVTIAADGFMSVNLAPNLGATPAGLYYTAVYHLSDGTTSTEYWVVPAAAQASLGSVRAQLLPAAQAVQTVSKSYVDLAIAELTQSLLTASGGTLTGPLYLNGDPTAPLQAADKHYVDITFANAVPLAGGAMTGALTSPSVNGVRSPAIGSMQTNLQSTVSAAGSNGAVMIPPSYAGTDGFTNASGVYVADLRTSGAQQVVRSVREFGAVCDGHTDDTSALQTALNYAQAHGVGLSIPQGTCKTQTLNWHGESIGGVSKQVSALMGFPGQDVLQSVADSPSLLAYTRLHDLTIYVDQSVDVSCTAARGRQAAGSCAINRPLEANTILSPGGNGLTGTAGTGTAWAVGNCAIAMPAVTGAGGNGLQTAEIENLEIATTGTDPMAQYAGAHSTHTCGMYLAQLPKWSEFRNIDIRGLNTGIALPALPGTIPTGLNADSNRWQSITLQTTHGLVMAAGSNNVLDNVVATVGNSAATGETPTGLVLDLPSTQRGWTVRNMVVLPSWVVVAPGLSVTASGGAVTAVTVGTEHGLGFDPYGTQVPLAFSGSCTAQATASVNSDGSIGTVTVQQGGVGCSTSTTAGINVAGTWDTAAAVNLIGGQNVTLLGGNLLKGNGGYTVWNAANSQSFGSYADGGSSAVLPVSGLSYPSLVVNGGMGAAFAVEAFPGADFGAKLQACVNTVSASNGGTCDGRNFTGTLAMSSNLTIATANTTVLLPCATIATAKQILVTAGTRNVTVRGCALRGSSAASGNVGGTVLLYSGAGAAVQVGDPTYVADTPGFHLDNVTINTTTAASATAQGLIAYRTQEMDLESLYFLGNANQTGMTLDGTGNYTGGTFYDNAFNGFLTAVNGIGHQIANAATTDWMNASLFARLHVDCPTSGGNPIVGTYGVNLQQGDGNTFIGGDVEGCNTALHLGANAQNNTIVGLRNENSTNQIVADAGSAYNNWMNGGTLFTGKLTDNGTRNSFLDTFHRSFNGMNGDWYGSQQDATVTNHWRLGTGTGNERGLLDRYQTDYGYRWTTGLSDATAGEQFYQILDELNNVYRVSIGQYNNGQSSTNNQTAINSAGTGAVVLNGSTNAGTGGVVIGSGGATESTVATISNTGSAQFNGTLQVGGVSTFLGSTTVKNQADAEIDQFLWAGATTSQKESFIYKDWNGASQWYMVKDASNNWALNSATGGLDSFKAYQSTNSGDTYIDASNASGVVRVNYETGAGTAFKVYGGSSSSLYASFTGTTAIQFPGLAAASGHSCLQVDNSGYVTNTGATCGTGNTNGTVGTGLNGQIAYYNGSGTALAGESTVPIANGGTNASTAATALANLGALPLAGGTMTGPLAATSETVIGTLGVTGATTLSTVTAQNAISANTPVIDARFYGAAGDGRWGADGAIASGATQFSSATVACTTADVGKLVSILGAGASGGELLTTVTSCASATVVNLAAAASTAVTSSAVWAVGTDNTAPLQAAINGAIAACGATLFVPHGVYLVNGNLRVSPTSAQWAACPIAQGYNSFPFRITGDGWGSSYLVENNPTAALLTASQINGPLHFVLDHVALLGRGSTTTGTLFEDISYSTLVEDVAFYGSGGRCLLQQAERLTTHNLKYMVCRQALVQGGDLGLNESYFFDTEILQAGSTSDPLTNRNYYQYNVNAVNGVLPASGNVIADMHAAVVLNGSYNILMEGGSIKPTGGGLAAIRVIPGSSIRLANLYIEGAGAPAANPALIFGGKNETTTTTAAMTNSSTNFTVADASWMRSVLSNSADLGTVGVTSYILYPPDYVYGSTAASSLGGGILKGSYENVTAVFVQNTAYATRAVNGTTAYAWPAGTIVNESYLNPAASSIPMIDSVHLNSTGSMAGYTLVSNPNSQEPAAEIVLGWMPDQFHTWGSGTGSDYPGYAFNGLHVAGDTRMYCGSPFHNIEVHGFNNLVIDDGGAYNSAETDSLGSFGGCTTGGIATVTYSDGATSNYTHRGPQFPLREQVGNMALTSNSAGQFVMNDATSGSTICTYNGTSFSCGSSSSGTVTSFAATGWPSWLTPSVSNATTTPSLSVAASSIPNAALANSSTTVAGQTCTLGSTCAVAASNLSNGTSGSGAVALVNAPTFTGNSTTFANASANSDYLVVQPGSAADQIGALEFANYAGSSQWEVRKDASNTLRIRDSLNGADRIIGYQAGQLGLNSAGSNAVVVNNTSGSGTGGFIVYNGGSTAELTVTGSGNTTATGFLSGKFYIGNSAMSAAAGAAAGSLPTVACATSCTGAQGTYSITTGTSTATGTLVTLSFPNTHSNTADCVGNLYLPGTGQVSNWEPVAGTTTLVVKVDTTALTASTAYKFTYWCGGN